MNLPESKNSRLSLAAAMAALAMTACENRGTLPVLDAGCQACPEATPCPREKKCADCVQKGSQETLCSDIKDRIDMLMKTGYEQKTGVITVKTKCDNKELTGECGIVKANSGTITMCVIKNPVSLNGSGSCYLTYVGKGMTIPPRFEYPYGDEGGPVTVEAIENINSTCDNLYALAKNSPHPANPWTVEDTDGGSGNNKTFPHTTMDAGFMNLADGGTIETVDAGKPEAGKTTGNNKRDIHSPAVLRTQQEGIVNARELEDNSR